MEQINTVELRDPNTYPDEAVLQSILGDSYTAYEALLELYDSMGMVCEWKYYKDGESWLCKVQKNKKTVVWMSAWRGYMQATMYIHEKYIEAIKKLEIEREEKERILSAKNVGKSVPCMFEVRDKGKVKDIEKVTLLKMSLQ